MRKIFEWLDTRRFPGDWAIADMIKQYLRGRRKQLTKQERVKNEVEAENRAKERRRRQAILEKRTHLAEDDPESLAIEASNNALTDEEVSNSSWPPARPHKKRHISPTHDQSSEESPLSEVDED